MEKKVQNIKGEDLYKDVIKSLKELPKIKAPDNFELNLMTRIHNRNFEIKNDKSYNFTVWGFLKPAAVVSLTAVIVFFVIDLNSVDMPNPLLTEPELIREDAASDMEAAPLQKEFFVEESVKPKYEKNDEISKTRANVPAVKNLEYKVVISENDVISKEMFELPLDDKSVDVDSKLKVTSAQGLKRAFLVGGAGKRQRMVFDGFHTRSIENKWLQDSLAKYSDSLQNIEEKSDKK